MELTFHYKELVHSGVDSHCVTGSREECFYFVPLDRREGLVASGVRVYRPRVMGIQQRF